MESAVVDTPFSGGRSGAKNSTYFWLRPAAGRIEPRLGIRVSAREENLSSLPLPRILSRRKRPYRKRRPRSFDPPDDSRGHIGLDEAASRNFLSFTSAATISFVPASSREARTNNIVLELDDIEMYLHPNRCSAAHITRKHLFGFEFCSVIRW